jgi:hypothetical protein
MTLQETGTEKLHRIQDEVAEEWNFTSWATVPAKFVRKMWPQVCSKYASEYARECVKASLEKAAENAKVEVNLTDKDKKTRQVIKEWGPIVSDSARMQSDAKVTVNKSSITDESNIVLL